MVNFVRVTPEQKEKDEKEQKAEITVSSSGLPFRRFIAVPATFLHTEIAA